MYNTNNHFYTKSNNYSMIHSPLQSLKNITFFQNYKIGQIKKKKVTKINKMGNFILAYDNIEPKNSKSHKILHLSGININNKSNGDNNNLISLSSIPISPFKTKLTKLNPNHNLYIYKLKKNQKKIEPLNLKKYEKSLKESVKLLNSRNLKNYSFPKIYSYQQPGTPRLIQNVFLKYTNEKRNIKIKIRRRNDYDELKHEIIGLRRTLYNPKKV